MKASPENQAAPPAGGKWAPGAEPLAICMSCSSTYPTHFTECPNCEVALSIVRKCPTCGRIQSAHHVTCIYCADSFMREDGLSPLKSGPLARRRELAQQRLRVIAGVAIAVSVAAGVAIFLTRSTWRGTPAVIGQTYVLAPVAMRSRAAADAPPVKDLKASEVLNITDLTHDVMGNRWFRVTSADVSGYLRTQDVAPPRSTDPEKGFEILRHSLMGLADPEVLPAATQAVSLYQTSFPASPHKEELRWLLAERTREMSERSRTKALLASARELYAEIAAGGGEFAERARQALEELPTDGPSAGSAGSSRPAAEPGEMGLSFVGGSTRSPREASPNPGQPVRRVTVVSRTPLIVRLTQPARLSPGTVFYGEIAQDVRVSREVAIPQGSSATGMVTQEGAARGTQNLQLTGATVRGETYRVSASATRLEIPGRSPGSASKSLPEALPVGTSIEFRLRSDLVITQR
jgi:hypothetical protein